MFQPPPLLTHTPPPGLHVTDADTGAHVLSCTALPPEVLPGLRPVMGRLLALAAAGALPEVTDGRVSAGPVDLRAFLALPRTQLLVGGPGLTCPCLPPIPTCIWPHSGCCSPHSSAPGCVLERCYPTP